MKKKILSMLLCATMVLSMLPTIALAVGTLSDVSSVAMYWALTSVETGTTGIDVTFDAYDGANEGSFSSGDVAKFLLVPTAECPDGGFNGAIDGNWMGFVLSGTIELPEDDLSAVGGKIEKTYTISDAALNANTEYYIIVAINDTMSNYLCQKFETDADKNVKVPSATATAAITTPAANGAVLGESGLATFAGTATMGTTGAPSATKWALKDKATGKYWNGSAAFDSSSYTWTAVGGTAASWTVDLSSIKTSLTSGKTYALVIHAQDDNTGVDEAKLATREFVYDNVAPTATWSPETTSNLIVGADRTVTITLNEKLFGDNNSAASSEITNEATIGSSAVTVGNGATGDTSISADCTIKYHRNSNTPSITVLIPEAKLADGETVKITIAANKLVDAAGNAVATVAKSYTVSAGTGVTATPATAEISAVGVAGTTTPSIVDTAIKAELAKITVKDGATVLTGKWEKANDAPFAAYGPNVIAYNWTYVSGGSNAPYAGTSVNVTVNLQKQLAASDFTTTGITKVYEGSDALSANVALTSPLNVSGVRNLTVTLTGTYDNKDVDTGKTLTVSGVAAKGDASDANWAKYYVLPAANTVTGLTGAITAKPVTLSEVAGPISVTLGDIAASDFAGGTFAGTETIDTAYGALTATVGDGSTSTTTLAAANDANFKAEFYKLADGKTDADMVGDPTAATLVKTNAAITTGDYYVLFNAPNKNPLGNYNVTGVATNSPTAAGDYVKVTVNPAPTGGGASSYTVIYEVGEHGALAEGAKRTESVNYGKFPKKVPAVVANEGYKFLGWSLDGKTVVEPTEQKINKRTTFTALYEAAATELAFDKEFTGAYIIGMEEGGEKVFKPEAAMTRGEVAVMLARTLNMKMEEGKDYATGKFPDLKGDEWYAQAIGFLAELDVMKGFEDGTCGAEKLISRAEFVTLIMRIDGIVTGVDEFPDVAGDYWAREFINAAAAKQYVDGDEYGNFMPTENITRASVVKIMNGVLGRNENVEAEMIFIDVPAGYWAYNDIIKASTGK